MAYPLRGYFIRKLSIYTIWLVVCTVNSFPLIGKEQENWWPFWVKTQSIAKSQVNQTSILGPLYSKQENNIFRMITMRPFFTKISDNKNQAQHYFFLYPFFQAHITKQGNSYNILSLIRSTSSGEKITTNVRTFEIWPFYFSNQTGKKDTSYRGLFPIGGIIKNHFGYDRIYWAMFPLYARFGKDDQITQTILWPFIKIYKGPQIKGMEIWPLVGTYSKKNSYDSYYILWPFYYNEERNKEYFSEQRKAFFPLYTFERTKNSVSKTWIWPFFGYTHNNNPLYHQIRYFWPLIILGKGNEKKETCLFPFYRRLVHNDDEKMIYLWPLIRKQSWEENNLRIKKRQLLLFLYSTEHQQSLNPQKNFHAQKTHLWPLYSYWKNGSGHKQFQLFSPLEPFFPRNQTIRFTYSPLFSIYRYNNNKGQARHSLFWDLITYQKNKESATITFGPIISIQKNKSKSQVKVFPSYNPHFNLIEKLWNKIKHLKR
jgi:hypothetical protein